MHRPYHYISCTIAGSDPTGGAGLQADLATFAAHGVRGTAVVTAVTSQGSAGLRHLEAMSAELLAWQTQDALASRQPSSIKIGMLPSAPAIEALASALADVKAAIVLDPVLSVSAGGWTLPSEGVAAIAEHLLRRADLITPNVAEARRLVAALGTAEPGAGPDALAAALVDAGARAVLVTGGDETGPESVDWLATPTAGPRALGRPRLDGPSPHGTGCTLSSAIAARLAWGQPLTTAVEGAKGYVHALIEMAHATGARALSHLAIRVEAPRAAPVSLPDDASRGGAASSSGGPAS